MPTRYTKSLTGDENFITDGDRLLRVVDKYWKERDVPGQFRLEDWQRWIIRHALERFPNDWDDRDLAGRLRWRLYWVSMAAQNGKSTLGAILGTYGLFMHEHSPLVLGLAQNKQSADEIYDRVGYAIGSSTEFSKAAKPTKTSGIHRVGKPGKYIIKASSDRNIQGLPASLIILDEMHLLTETLLAQARKRLSARKDGIIIGLTTAGDDSSKMLLNLYTELDQLVARQELGDPDLTSRVGGAVWEAPEGSSLASDEAIRAANPRVTSGSKALSVVRSEAKDAPWVDQQRYTLNRFVPNIKSWLEDMNVWHQCAGKGLVLDEGGPYVYGIDVSGDTMSYATITMNAKHDKVKSRIVASLVKPTEDQLLQYCKYLWKRNGACGFVVYGRSLKGLGEKLLDRGFKDTFILNDTEYAQACTTFFRMMSRKQFETRNEQTLRNQVPRAVRKNVTGGFYLAKSHSSTEIDALVATAMGAYIAETKAVGQRDIF